jgi:hypothetical protein
MSRHWFRRRRPVSGTAYQRVLGAHFENTYAENSNDEPRDDPVAEHTGDVHVPAAGVKRNVFDVSANAMVSVANRLFGACDGEKGAR